jgi:thiosulfate dehydrogenase
MKSFVAGVIVTLVCLAAGVYFCCSRGYVPVATDSRPLPFEAQLANLALHAKVLKEMPKTIPIEANEPTYLAGAHTYVDHCAVCHGTTAGTQTAIARGEFPKPPQLLHGQGVTDDPPGETYWKVANGIRLTGMPGFHNSLSSTQIWQVSLMLANANSLPASVTAVLSAPAPTTAAHP